MMREFDRTKDIYEYDYTDITRKGDAIIQMGKQDPLYSRYQPDTLGPDDEKMKRDPEVEEIRNMGLSKYLRLLGEGKIDDNAASQEELEALRSLSKKYRNKIYYQDNSDDEQERSYSQVKR